MKKIILMIVLIILQGCISSKVVKVAQVDKVAQNAKVVKPKPPESEIKTNRKSRYS